MQAQKFLVSLIRGGEKIPVKLFDSYSAASAFATETTPCHSDSPLLLRSDYACVQRAINACDPERGSHVPGIGWEITGFFADGTVALCCRCTADTGLVEFPQWVEGEYESIL